MHIKLFCPKASHVNGYCYQTFCFHIQDKKGSPTGEEGDEKKFDPSGYDKDLVENLERDIVQRNPDVHW